MKSLPRRPKGEPIIVCDCSTPVLFRQVTKTSRECKTAEEKDELPKTAPGYYGLIGGRWYIDRLNGLLRRRGVHVTGYCWGCGRRVHIVHNIYTEEDLLDEIPGVKIIINVHDLPCKRIAFITSGLNYCPPHCHLSPPEDTQRMADRRERERALQEEDAERWVHLRRELEQAFQSGLITLEEVAQVKKDFPAAKRLLRERGYIPQDMLRRLSE